MEIDLNADLGEGGPHDRELLTLVTSANISCGAHAGTEDDIASAIHHALQHDVSIGAHPSYPDRAHFGRRPLMMSPDRLRKVLFDQMKALKQRVEAEGGVLRHVKPHGALYNQAAGDRVLAGIICEAVESIDGGLVVVGLAGSAFVDEARGRGMIVTEEAFADRCYADDGLLVPRTDPGAILPSEGAMARQGMALASGAGIASINGIHLDLKADTLCLHGDHPEALDAARHLRRLLEENGIAVRRPQR
jgi:UPF0271 protein